MADILAVGGIAIGPYYMPTVASGTAASSGANALVAAPGAGKRLVIKEIIVQNESSTATTVILKEGTTSCWRALLDQYRSLSLSFAVGEEWRLTANTALNLDLSGANSHGYSIRYSIETV
jgi:hypothetical protein